MTPISTLKYSQLDISISSGTILMTIPMSNVTQMMSVIMNCWEMYYPINPIWNLCQVQTRALSQSGCVVDERKLLFLWYNALLIYALQQFNVRENRQNYLRRNAWIFTHPCCRIVAARAKSCVHVRARMQSIERENSMQRTFEHFTRLYHMYYEPYMCGTYL